MATFTFFISLYVLVRLVTLSHIQYIVGFEPTSSKNSDNFNLTNESSGLHNVFYCEIYSSLYIQVQSNLCTTATLGT